MSESGLRSLITHALVDDQLRTKLLDGERDCVLAQFDLSDQERQVLRDIRAPSLQAFAAQLQGWLQSQADADLAAGMAV
ncbi:MAG: hypothetical protein ACP5KN_21140 [Armatimonadota bacterium]